MLLYDLRNLWFYNSFKLFLNKLKMSYLQLKVKYKVIIFTA